MLYSLIYLYVLGSGVVLGGIFHFINAIVQAQPSSPSLEAVFTSAFLVMAGLAVVAVTRVLDVIHHNTRLATLAVTTRR